MLRKYSIISLVCLLIISGLVLSYKIANKTKEFDKEDQTDVSSSDTIKLPIALDHPRVGSAFVHYFISGKLKEVTNTASGYQIILEESDKLPNLIVSPQTRISKITPPYGAATSEQVSISQLKSGQTIDLSIEYDVRATTWIIHDVFLPTDRN